MGRVFSLEQIREPEAYIPCSNDFEEGIAHFGSAVSKEIDEGLVSGALIYGSVAIRAYTIRSDVDCLIAPYDHSPRSIAALRRILEESNPTGRLEMSVIAHPLARLESGSHEIDKYFGDHLRGTSRLVYGADPTERMTFLDLGAYIHLLGYLRHKKRSVADTFVSYGQDHLRDLQRVLELPLAIGRKALRTLDELNDTNNATADSANKTLITPLSLDLFDSYGIGDVPRRVVAHDRLYTQMVQEAVQGGVNEKEYSDALYGIELLAGEVSGWLDEFETLLTGTADIAQFIKSYGKV